MRFLIKFHEILQSDGEGKERFLMYNREIPFKTDVNSRLKWTVIPLNAGGPLVSQLALKLLGILGFAW